MEKAHTHQQASPEPNWYTQDKEILCAEMQRILLAENDVFYGLSNLRDFVNRHFPTFEFYQEDVWNERTEGETHLESIIRCRQTLNETEPFAYDAYLNHRDPNGVWHLDDYQRTVFLMETPMPLVEFLFQYRPESIQ